MKPFQGLLAVNLPAEGGVRGGAMDHSVHNEQSFNSKFPLLKVNGRVISWTEIVAEKKGRLMEVENVQC